MNNKLQDFFKTYKFTIIFVALGIVLTTLFLTIGFWRTLLLLVLVGVCFLVGFLLDQNGLAGLKDFCTKLFSNKKQ